MPRPARPPAEPDQPDLFADAGDTTASAVDTAHATDATDSTDAAASPASAPPAPEQALVRVAATDRPLSKPQREFNRLTDLIARQRQALADWRAMQDRCQQRAASHLAPEQKKLAGLQRDTVLWIDAYLSAPPRGERLTKKPRQKLVFLLLTLAREVLECQPDPEVEAAHDRHAAQDHAEAQRMQLEMAAGMLGEATGDHGLFEGDAGSVEEMLQRAAERLRSRADSAAPDSSAADGAPEPWAGPSARARKAEARDAKAREEASQSVRDVYRRLASSLHPDREPDAAERARKTALMARVNEAYGRNDLLALLTVQLEIEQIDAGHLAGLPDQRLKHFCLVLRDQLQAIEAELDEVTAPVAASLGARPDRVKPGDLLQLLDRQLALTRQACAALAQENQWLRDPATRADFLRQLQIDDPDELIDPFQEMLLRQAMDEAMADLAAQPAKGKRRRR